MDAILRRRIRMAYKEHMPVILSERSFRIDPYIFDFDMPMTPIERNVWGDIRTIGLPFFMQVPVGPYFIDFADPVKKIGIEVDGKEFHQDHEADANRERELNVLGWKIYRIPGRMTFITEIDFIPEGYFDSSYDESDYTMRMKMYRSGSSRGVLMSIRENHYSEKREEMPSQKLVSIRDIIGSVMGKIESRLDARIASRIAGMCEDVPFAGQDRRMGN